MEIQNLTPRLISFRQARLQGGIHALKATCITLLMVLFLFFTFSLSAIQSDIFILKLIKAIGIFKVLVFIISVLSLSYVFGIKAGERIIIEKKNYCSPGYILGFLIVLSATLFTSFAALTKQVFTQGLPVGWFVAFIARPVVWLLPLSIIPVGIAAHGLVTIFL